MRSHLRSSDTSDVAEGKTLAGTSQELRSRVQSFCSADRNNRARDKNARLHPLAQLHDSRSRSPSGTHDNAGTVIRPSLRESFIGRTASLSELHYLTLARSSPRGVRTVGEKSPLHSVENPLLRPRLQA